MINVLAAFALLPVAAPQTSLPSPTTLLPGKWDVTSTMVDAVIPGAPGFLVRMMRGKSKAEHKRVIAGQTIEVLLAPDPKAKCRVDAQRIADGRYTQQLSCPQKRGEAMRIARAGTYTRDGFAGRATVSGATPKGALNIVLDQRAGRVGD